MDPQLLTRDAADFKVFSGLLKAYEADGRKKISGVTSSTVKDLHGDVMELSALQSMERSAKNNMTIWLNHEYEVPKDIFGSALDARITQRGSDVWDLDIDIAVNETNPRALDTWAAINAGTKLGLSIGALLKDYTLEKDGSFVIRDVELLEASVVSIPANPRSWVQYAVKAAKAKEAPPVTTNVTVTQTASNGANFEFKTADVLAVSETAEADAGLEACAECGEAPDACKCNNGKPPNARRNNEATPDVQAQEAPSTESDPEDADGEPITASASDVEASTEDASDGDAADGEQTADAVVTETIGDLTSKSITELIALLRTTTSELVTTKAELVKVSGERDLAAKGFFAAIEIVEKVSDLPLSRKAQGAYGQASASMTRLRSVYSEQFMQMLESKNNG